MYMYGEGGVDIQVVNVVVGMGCVIGRGRGQGKWMYKSQSVIQQQAERRKQFMVAQTTSG